MPAGWLGSSLGKHCAPNSKDKKFKETSVSPGVHNTLFTSETAPVANTLSNVRYGVPEQLVDW
jgi:hypothetical protein